MQHIFSRISSFKLPKKNEMGKAISSFSKKEWKVFIFLIIVLLISTVFLLEKVNKYFMVEIPTNGGAISEGIIGTPRFVNPALALSDADKDLVSLVYSGLMRKDVDGTLIPDLAEKYDISKDGLSYTFTLKNKIYFHDKKPVTADDVLFTINQIKDPLTKSPKKGSWDGVNVEKIDEKTIKFNLKQAYASFLDNATIGIIPEHIWKDSPIEQNTANINAVGSGPYMISNVNKQSSGVINYYDLVPFNKFALGTPHVTKITLHFYANEEDLMIAMGNGTINQVSSITTENAKKLEDKNYLTKTSILPRIFGLFFNQNQAQIFTDKAVVKAINEAIDKDKIVNDVLGGYGVAIDNPIPPSMIDYEKLSAPNKESHAEKIAKAIDILTKDGWKKNADGYLEKTTTVKKKKTTSLLEFSISTSNAPDLAKSADLIKQNLEEVGIKVNVKTFEIGNLNQSVIRPRDYDALLFGQIINHESDILAFWHSSQRKDPGLNVAMYANPKVDKILEDAFVTIDIESRIKKYAQFEEEIRNDVPAVFLYSPDFIYVVSKDLKGVSINHLTSPSDRFSNIYMWYTATDSVWKIFAH